MGGSSNSSELDYGPLLIMVIELRLCDVLNLFEDNAALSYYYRLLSGREKNKTVNEFCCYVVIGYLLLVNRVYQESLESLFDAC